MAMHDFFKGLKPVIASGVAGVSGVAPANNPSNHHIFTQSAERNTSCNTAARHEAEGVLTGVSTGHQANCRIPPYETPATPETPDPFHDEYWHDFYEERAAIMEFEGELPRLEAERLANEWILTLKKENDDDQHFTMH